MYFISHPGLELEIKIEEIKKLYIHEEIIPEIVDWLSFEIKWNTYKHPVIVDKETLVVLDGMHRVAALQHLGYKLIPVCLVNYSNPSITVRSWFRTIENGQKTGENVRKDLEELGYNLQEIANNELKRRMHDREIIIGIVTSRKRYGIPGKIESIKEIYEYIKQLERNLRSVGYKIGYETESDAVKKVKSGKALAAIMAPRITKRDVVTTALSREVFVHKSTRHVIPARPLFVNVPIEWLNMDLKEANKLLLEHLSKKKLRHLPPGQTLDRRYEEELYVFSDA
ncbi:MAG: ParB N-terminal domain-containing protein [Candidatus Bathyarchaeota archaeon]|nr:ParB N-terminal domain-containing protein [Candidatus Bathyarchaeota archaeon]MDH5663086.1 ParB N-terminal domain-containing protein [Candidatus Bathyarchaeota archaeon]